MSELRHKPAGTIRITTSEHAAETILLPALAKVLPQYPNIHVETVIDFGLTDIVSQRYDAGIRLGEQIAKNMIAIRMGPDMRMAAVTPPSCFAKRPRPKKPKTLRSTRASISNCRPTADFTPGNSRRMAGGEGAGRGAAPVRP